MCDETMTRLPPGLREALEQLPRGLYDHIQRVRQEAQALAEALGLDVEQVDLAAAAHDIARAMSGEALLVEAARRSLSVHVVETHLPVLLHGPVGAARLQGDLGVEDSQVLEAVHWHSTGVMGMGSIGQAVFLADKLDPTKAARYPFIGEVRELAHQDLDRAMLLFLNGELQRLVQSGQPVHPAALEARNELLLRLKSR